MNKKVILTIAMAIGMALNGFSQFVVEQSNISRAWGPLVSQDFIQSKGLIYADWAFIGEVYLTVQAYEGTGQQKNGQKKEVLNNLLLLETEDAILINKWDKTKKEKTKVRFNTASIVSYFPETIYQQDTTTVSISYTDFIPLLVEAIKEQQMQIEQLQAEVNKLSKKE